MDTQRADASMDGSDDIALDTPDDTSGDTADADADADVDAGGLQIVSVSPRALPTSGGPLTIEFNLAYGDATIDVGGAPCAYVTPIDTTHLSCDAPASPAGTTMVRSLSPWTHASAGSSTCP